MKAVFKKEVRSLLFSYAGMAFIGLFLCFAGAMTAYWNLSELSSSFEVIFAYMPFAAIALIPLLTIGAFSKERREGTDRFLALLPLSTKDIVLGKYFARLFVAMIPNVILIFTPLILNIWGEVNYATAYVTLLVFSILECLLISVCLYIDAHCKRRYLAAIIPYGVLVLWFALGVIGENIPASNAFLRAFGDILSKLSPFSLFNGFLYGLFDFRVVFAYLATAILFVALCIWAFASKNGVYASEDYKNTAQKKASVTLSLVMAFAIIFANVCVMLTPERLGRIDITSQRTYTLSEETKDFLASLDKDVTVYAVNFEDSEYRIKLFLDRMASYSDSLAVRDIDTEKDIDFAVKYGLDGYDASSLANSIIVESADRIQMIYYSSLFTYTNNSEYFGFERISASEFQQYYSAFASNEQYAEYLNILITETDMYFEGQNVISRAIEYVAADYIPSLYVLGGHETDISGTLLGQLGSYYGMTPKTLNITDGSPVTMDVASLMIATPKTDLSESELSAIMAYLEKGGQVTALTNESNLEMKNLMSLLDSYGMTASAGILAEQVTIENESEESAEEPKTEESKTLTVYPNYDHDIMATIASQGGEYSAKITNANSIKLNEGKDSSLLLTPILKTSENAYFAGAENEKATHIVAAAAERARGDRVVWLTAADSFLGVGDMASFDEQQINNTMAVLFAQSWTNNVYSSQLSEAPASQYMTNGLQMSETASTVLGMIFVAVIPAAAVAVAAIIRYKREKA
ncbi:MAG: hypothetical protein E7670_06030 [Ruminococcaceae bacterium]|nr:hypothetical protein [Oscillospiraceae bacterium]